MSCDRSKTWLLMLACLTMAGCARSLERIDSSRDAFAMGDLVAASESLSELAGSKGRFADSASLDLAIVQLALGDISAAESRLRHLRDRFDAIPEVSPLSEAASLMTDDTARVFRPAGYEEVMIRAMLAVCSLAGDASDAESYALQAAMKQSELARIAADRGVLGAGEVYQPIAMAPYLRGMLREATHNQYDDAARAYKLVSTVRPEFMPAADDIARASGGTHSAPGHGVLYVIALVGRGPQLRQTTAPTTTAAMSIASAVLNAQSNQAERGETAAPVLPNIASVKVPEVVLPPSPIATIGARINGTLFGATQTLTDVSELASRQAEAEMPWTIARAVLRRTAKESTVALAGDSLGLDAVTGSLFHFAAASAWAGSESADTRCWGLLPREIQVLRAELPSGMHQLQLEPMGFAGQLIAPGRVEPIEIIDGRNQYVIVIAPGKVIYVTRR